MLKNLLFSGNSCFQGNKETTIKIKNSYRLKVKEQKKKNYANMLIFN